MILVFKFGAASIASRFKHIVGRVGLRVDLECNLVLGGKT